MSTISGFLDPEARATLDAIFAKWAAPGMCNPDDQTPCVDGTPSQAHLDKISVRLPNATTMPSQPSDAAS